MMFPRPQLRYPTRGALPTPVLPVPSVTRKPVFSKPSSQRFAGTRMLSGVGGRGIGGWGLGSLGDNEAGSAALTAFKSYLVTHIASKAGAAIGSAAQSTQSIGACINFCATIWQNGQAGALAADQQAAWNAWAAAASDPNSDYNIYWMFGALISDAQSDLITASNAYESNMWIDPSASAASYTMMDSSVSGTTWYGGATVTSSLNNSQWGTVFTEAFTVMQKGVAYGTLPLTYLQLVCQAMLAAPNDRRFPFFQAPGVTNATDPQGIAFRAALKQLGWSKVVNDWYSDTQQAWAGANAQLEAQDVTLGAVITVLDYTSGEVILQQVQDKANAYFTARAAAVQALSGYQSMLAGPAGTQISAQDQATMTALMQRFTTIDQSAFTAINSIGMWSAGPAGSLNGLGLATLIISGVIAITVLGVIAFVVDEMTSTGRAAADQTAALSKSILATVQSIQQSCSQVWQNSQQTSTDQATYQKCLQETQAWYATIPPPPAASTDPLGFKSIATFGAVAIVGIVALYFIKKHWSGGGGGGGGGSSAPAAAAPAPA